MSETLSSKVSPTALRHWARKAWSCVGSSCYYLRSSIRQGEKREARTLYARKMPSPTSLITASTSISHVPFPSSTCPNQPRTWHDTTRRMSWSSSSAERSVAMGAAVCGRERETRFVRMSSRIVVRCDRAIGRNSPVSVQRETLLVSRKS